MIRKNWCVSTTWAFPTASLWISNANCSFPWRHWLYSNSQLLLLLLPGNILYFVVQLCSGAEHKSAFHLISSHHTSISLDLYIWVYICTCLQNALLKIICLVSGLLFWIVLLLVVVILCCSILHKEAKWYVLFKASECGSISVHVTGKKVPTVWIKSIISSWWFKFLHFTFI